MKTVVWKFWQSFLHILAEVDRLTRWMGPLRDVIVVAYALLLGYVVLMALGGEL